jgi:diguanylate cyclase (GGDEF)-like protein
MPWDSPRPVSTTGPLVVHPTDLRSLVDSSPMAVAVADSRGLIRFVNQPASVLLGSAPHDLIGNAFPFAPDDQTGEMQKADGKVVQVGLRWTQLIWEGNLAWSAVFEPLEQTSPGPVDPEMERRLQEAEMRCETLHRQVQQLEDDHVKLNNKLSRTESESADLSARCETLTRRSVQAESRIKDTEEAALQGWSEAEERARLAESLVKELQGEIGKMDVILREARESQQQAQKDYDHLKSAVGDPAEAEEQLGQARQQLAEQLDRMAIVEAELERLQAKAAARDAQVQTSDEPAQPERVAELERQLAEEQARAHMAEQLAEGLKTRLGEVTDEAKLEKRELRKKLAEASHEDHETKRLAFEDRLTGLPNFNIMQQFLDYTVDMVARQEGAAALLVIDIDRFRSVNHSLGYAQGDELLVQIAERLKAIKRPNEVLARRREDEFVLIYSLESNELNEARTTAAQVAQAQAGKILAAIAEPFTVGTLTLTLTCSIGITALGFPSETTVTVLEQGAAALDRAREQGRNRYQVYGAELQERARRRIQIIPRLRDALENQEFALQYQPIVELKGGRMVGIEALLRWKDPNFGLLEPAEFLPFAEESGLILPIGEWSFQEACQTAALYRDLFVSINLSPRQLLQSDFSRRFMKAVERARVRPERIVVEVSETTHSWDPERISQVLAELSRWKVQVAIDDFGTSSSSLSRLHIEGMRFIKLDNSFSSQVTTDKTAYHVCLAFCHLAATLELRSLAEGVETKEQMALLRKMGCQLAQGHFFSPPVAGSQIKELVRKTWKVT